PPVRGRLTVDRHPAQPPPWLRRGGGDRQAGPEGGPHDPGGRGRARARRKREDHRSPARRGPRRVADDPPLTTLGWSGVAATTHPPTLGFSSPAVAGRYWLGRRYGIGPDVTSADPGQARAREFP